MPVRVAQNEIGRDHNNNKMLSRAQNAATV